MSEDFEDTIIKLENKIRRLEYNIFLLEDEENLRCCGNCKNYDDIFLRKSYCYGRYTEPRDCCLNWTFDKINYDTRLL